MLMKKAQIDHDRLAFLLLLIGTAWHFRKADWRSSRTLLILITLLSVCGVGGAVLGPTPSWSLRQCMWVLALFPMPIGMQVAREVLFRKISVVVGASAVEPDRFPRGPG